MLSDAPARVLKILLVEDSVIDVKMAQAAIRMTKAPFDLVVADRGENAKEQLVGGLKPDLILLDLNLPGIYGLELLRWLKQETRWKAIPVTVFTTSVRPSDIDEAYQLGACCYIQKPPSMDGMVKIFEVLSSLWSHIALLR